MKAIFIDGPLAGEVKNIPSMPTYRVPECDCDPWNPIIICEHEPEIFVYYAVMHGGDLALMSKHSDPEEILHSLKQWYITDLTKDLHFHCRERRGFQ